MCGHVSNLFIYYNTNNIFDVICQVELLYFTLIVLSLFKTCHFPLILRLIWSLLIINCIRIYLYNIINNHLLYCS